MPRPPATTAFERSWEAPFGQCYRAGSGWELWQAQADQAQPVKCNDVEVTIVGTDGDDLITGTPDRDLIHGLAGNDSLDGGGGMM